MDIKKNAHWKLSYYKYFIMRLIRYISISGFIIFFTFCGRDQEAFDAFGHFETEETNVYAENPGRLIDFNVEAGMIVDSGYLAGLVDTSGLILQKKQVFAQIRSAEQKIPGIMAQKNVVEREISAMDFEISRLKRLVESGAATQKQLDDLQNKKMVAEARLVTFDKQVQSVKAEIGVLKAQIEIIEDQVGRSLIKSPFKGTILETFVKESELVSPGKVLFSLAGMESMTLKAYVSGNQLSQIELGQDVKIRIDWQDDTYREYSGSIFWISDEAEFTPKIIQTKEERVHLVYAIKIRVKNDGKLKIGMPGEVIFKDER